MERSDAQLLERAVQVGSEGMRALRGGPFGALVVRGGEILAEASNSVTSTHDPTAHAEVNAIRAACSRVRNFSLAGAVIYSSCEPCPMCLGAIHWARIDRLVYSSTRQDAAAIDFDDRAIYDAIAGRPNALGLQIQQIPLESAAELFRSWSEMENRIEY